MDLKDYLGETIYIKKEILAVFPFFYFLSFINFLIIIGVIILVNISPKVNCETAGATYFSSAGQSYHSWCC